MKIRINEYNLISDKLSDCSNILSISDIHSNVNVLKELKKLTKYAKYLFISGDILDSVNDPFQEYLIKELKLLSNYINIVLTLGNHDIVEYVDNKSRKKKREVDITYLFDELKNTVNILKDRENYFRLNPDISVGSINMPLKWYGKHENVETFNKVLKSWASNIDDDKFNILLSHSPNALIQDNRLSIVSNKKPDLILCGHNHGGLTPQFIQNKSKSHVGLVGPYANLIKENAFGYWTTNDSSLILSNGITKISYSSWLAFVSNMLNSIYIPDVELVHLKPGKSHSLSLVKKSVKKL